MLTVVKVWLQCCPLIAQAEPPIKQLDPATRVKLLAALAGFVILGFGMLLLTWLGGRAVRRYMQDRPRGPRWTPVPRPSDDDWADRPFSSDPEKTDAEGG
jgi:hypothetical protein